MTSTEEITRIDRFRVTDSTDGFWCKREDLAGWERPEWPSGAKVRQYNKMCIASPGLPVLVGCSAHSAQQIYCAAAGLKFSRKVIIYIPANKKRTPATEYVAACGAELELNELKPPCFPSVYRARARARARELGGCVRWDGAMAVRDTIYQTQNVPRGVKRIVIPTGSGLTAAGVLAGCAIHGIETKVFAYAVSEMALHAEILETATKHARGHHPLPELTLVPPSMPYKAPWGAASLEDGTPLDPYYSAKVLPYVYENDLLWLTGLRPVDSMPTDCRRAFSGWAGPRQ